MMRVLLDQRLAPRATPLLRAAGGDAIHVAEIGLHRADDMTRIFFRLPDGKTVCVLSYLLNSEGQ